MLPGIKQKQDVEHEIVCKKGILQCICLEYLALEKNQIKNWAKFCKYVQLHKDNMFSNDQK